MVQIEQRVGDAETTGAWRRHSRVCACMQIPAKTRTMCWQAARLSGPWRAWAG